MTMMRTLTSETTKPITPIRRAGAPVLQRRIRPSPASAYPFQQPSLQGFSSGSSPALLHRHFAGLQQTIGNQAVAGMVSRSLPSSRPASSPEQRNGHEAGSGAAQEATTPTSTLYRTPDPTQDADSQDSQAMPQAANMPDNDTPAVPLSQGQSDGATIKEACEGAREDCKSQMNCPPDRQDLDKKCTCWKGGMYGADGYTCTVGCRCKEPKLPVS
jgi:hypothetical protein